MKKILKYTALLLFIACSACKERTTAGPTPSPTDSLDGPASDTTAAPYDTVPDDGPHGDRADDMK